MGVLVVDSSVRPKGSLCIRFDRSLYTETAVQAAVDAFAGFATISVTKETDGWTAVLEDPDPRHADILVDELANYALSETVAAHRSRAVT